MSKLCKGKSLTYYYPLVTSTFFQGSIFISAMHFPPPRLEGRKSRAAVTSILSTRDLRYDKVAREYCINGKHTLSLDPLCLPIYHAPEMILSGNGAGYLF